MPSARSFLLILLTVITFLFVTEAFRFSLIPATSSMVRKSLRTVDVPKLGKVVSCNQFLSQQQTGTYQGFVTCLMASKDMPLISDSGRRGFSYVGFSRLAPHQARLFPFHETRIAATLSHFSYLEKVDETAEHGSPIVVESDPAVWTRAHVWINKRAKTAFVSFRGTNSLVDVVHDLDMRPVPVDASVDQNVTVHAGFRYKFFTIKKALEDVLRDNKDDFDTLVVTGHSLGGALATIAAPFLSDMFPGKSVKCISFGSPRVGNENFVKWFQSTVDTNVRIVNEQDPVPHLPLGSAYHHVSDGICIVPGSGIYSFPDIPVNQRLPWAMENLDLSKTGISHFLQTYISRVNMYN